MKQVLQLTVVVFTALATGGLMVNWIGLGRAMSRVSVSTYVDHQATNLTFDPYRPIVVGGHYWVSCARDSFSRDSFAHRRIGGRRIRLLCVIAVHQGAERLLAGCMRASRNAGFWFAA